LKLNKAPKEKAVRGFSEGFCEAPRVIASS
jgi:hypothetical protein